MQQIQQYSQQIKQLVLQYQTLIFKSHLYQTNRIKWKQSCIEKQRKIKNILLQMKQEIDQLPSSTAATFARTYKDHQNKLSNLSKEFQNKLKVQVKIDTIKREIPKLNNKLTDLEQPLTQSPETNRTIQAVIKRGDNQISRMKDALQSMNIQLQQGMRLAQQINIQLNRQIQQLDNIQDKVKDTGATLNRAKKTINFFVKAAQCDKCLVGLIISILLALVAFVVLIVKKSP